MKSTGPDLIEVRNQVFLLERAIAALRHSIDHALASDPAARRQHAHQRLVDSGLTRFLNRNNEIATTEGSNYHQIEEGVWLSYEFKEQNGCAYRSVGVTAQGLEREDASCLMLRPKFDPAEPSGWLTLDSVFERAHLTGLKSLRISFVCGFRSLVPGASSWAARDLENFNICIRSFRPDGSFDDSKVRSFPAVEAPLPFAIDLPKPLLEALIASGPGEARLMFNLPINSPEPYEFAISAFQLEGTTG